MGGAQSSDSGVTFDPKAGTITYMKVQGDAKSVTKIVLNDETDLGKFIDVVQQNMKEGQAASNDYPKSVGIVNVENLGKNFMEFISKKEDLPRLQAVVLKEPPVRAVVYVDKEGKSNFLYVKDQNKILELVPGGVRTRKEAIKVEVAKAKVVEMKTEIDRKTQCLSESIIPVMTPSQKEEIEKNMQACMARSTETAMKTVEAAAPAPAAVGTSTYAAQGVPYSIQYGGAYPLWVVILSISAIVAALLIAKKSV